jgi:hypothetical protein
MNNGRKLKVKWLSGRGSEQERRNKEREVRKGRECDHPISTQLAPNQQQVSA